MTRHAQTHLCHSSNPLHHRWHFVPSHARPSSDVASVH